MFTITTHSAQETMRCGELFSKTLKNNDIVLFEGSLGGGKTTFIKGILKGFGYKKRVLSPTFTLAREYHIKKKAIYHLDLNRLTTSDIFGSMLEDYFYPREAITLIEWGDRAESIINKFIKVEFIFLSENKRKLIFSMCPSKTSGIVSLRKCLSRKL